MHIFDKNKLPYGLIRSGVAPDHQHMKFPPMKRFNSIFEQNAHRLLYFGNVDCAPLYSEGFFSTMGYSHLVLAHGHSRTRNLGFPTGNSVSAMDLVKLYNHGSEKLTPNFNLDPCRSLTIVGGGNVTLDLVRLILKTPEELSGVASRAFLDLKQRIDVQEINLLIRGPTLPSKMSTQALREISSIPGVKFDFFNADLLSAENGNRKDERLLKLMQEMQAMKPSSESHIRNLNFIYKTLPTAITKIDGKMFINLSKQTEGLLSKMIYNSPQENSILTDNVS